MADATQAAKPPKVFISYAWSDDDYRNRVVEFATRLRNDGIDVVLDIWDLELGHDKYDFMERAAKDSEVTHVLMLCDRFYAEKADKRRGGVGDETQIITPEVYSSTRQEKFVPVLMERDVQDQPYLPTYLKARVWIDLSSSEAFPEQYERLIRRLHGRPEYPKPPLGKIPKHLDELADTGSPLVPQLQRALHAINNEKRNARSMVEDYLDALSAQIAGLRAIPDASRSIDAVAVDAMVRGKVYRDEFVEVLEALCRADALGKMDGVLEKFFEELLAGCEHNGGGQWYDAELDPPRFMANELFLYATTILLKRGQLRTLTNVLNETYVKPTSRGDRRKGPYGVFWFGVESIGRYRRQQRGPEPISPFADFLKERADRSTVPFAEIQQMDLLLYLRGILGGASGASWWPRTLAHVSRFNSEPTDLFLAPESTFRRERLKAVLAVADYEEFVERFKAWDPKSRVLEWGHGFGVALDPLVGLPSRR